MCDNLSHSVTLVGNGGKETGNTETPGHGSSSTAISGFCANAPFSGPLATLKKVGMASAMSYVQQKQQMAATQ
jgi:hypothetical protein